MKELFRFRRERLAIFLIGLTLVVLAEVIARILIEPLQLNPYYVELSSDFAGFDAFVEDAQKESALTYYDEFIYATHPFTSTHVNFTGYYSARWTPDSVPLAQAEHIVWAFGGSTMHNMETTDSLTIANTWAKVFNETIGPTHVKNFGARGFFSTYELIKFQKLLRDVPENERPSTAIFYDGYNDAQYGFQYGPGSLQKDISLKLQALVEQDDLKIGIYALSRSLSAYSRL